jgi:xylulokinase
MLAAKGCGDVSSIAECGRQWIKAGRTYEPYGNRAAKYQERYRIYKDLYGTLKPIRDMLQRFS